MTTSLRRVRRGTVLELTLDRPETRNAFDRQLFDALTDALKGAEADPSVRVTIVTGVGEVFCSGMDLREFAESQTIGDHVEDSFLNLERSKPLIVAVNGPAVAAGFELVLASDLAVVAPTASFSFPEAQRGLVAGGGGIWRLVRAAGLRPAVAVLLAGEVIGAQRAVDLGIVNRLVAARDLLGETRAIADSVAAAAPYAASLTLSLARRSFDLSEEELWQLGLDASQKASASRDAREGALAFLERRAPHWEGR